MYTPGNPLYIHEQDSCATSLKFSEQYWYIMTLWKFLSTYAIIEKMKQLFTRTAFLIAVFFIVPCTSSCKSYPASFEVAKFIEKSSDTVKYIEGDSYFIVMPEESKKQADTGIIFYPGGLVEFQAYLPLMEKLAEKGAFCILVEMPFDFAFLDFQAAGRFLKLYPEIKKWYMAGHSLGGAMAASYISRHKKDFEGLILLAAYSTHNIAKSDLKVLSIYGSKDGVLNRAHYDKYKKKLPPLGKGLTEVIIEGGNHAQFASYGAQKGDYMPDISCEKQMTITAEEISLWAGLTTDTTQTGVIEK